MRRSIVLLTALLLASMVACNSMDSTQETMTSSPGSRGSNNKKEAEPAKILPFAVQRTTLDNGLRVIVVPTPSDGLVSYWSIVRTGSRDEVEEGVTGFAHFFEHMMFKGTDKLPGGEYDKIVNGMGADANAFTTDDFTAYHLSFAKEDLPKVVEIEADRFQNLKYDQTQFQTESGAVYGEYRKGRTSPFEVLEEAVRNRAFDKHTYKHTTIGFESDIQAMPKQFDYSKSFFHRFYRPENVVLLVTGDVDPAKTILLIKQEYGLWRTGYTAPKVAPEPAQTEKRRVDVPFDGQTLPVVQVNFKGEAFQPENRTYVAALLAGELGFGETSKLYKKLVLDEQRVESLFAGFDESRDPGLWSVTARVKEAADVPAVEAEIWEAVAELRKNPVDKKRLDAVRSNMRYGFLGSLSTAAETAGTLARFVALTGDVSAVNPFFATLSDVTAEDVKKAANTWLLPERSTVAILHTKGTEVPTTAVAARNAAAPTNASETEAAATPEPAPASAAAPAGRIVQSPVLLPVESDPEVSFKIWFQVGSQDDPPGKEGLAELTAQMISEGGTERLPYDKILEQLYPLASSWSATVDKEMTVISGSVHKDNVEKYTELLVDAITRPGFRKDDFERLRDQAVSGIENVLRFSSDEELGKATLQERVFAGTPYGHLDEGTVASLKSITLEDVKAFHKAHYTRDDVVLGIGGGYAKSLPEKLAGELGRLQSGKPERAPAPKAPAIQGRNVTLVEKEGPSTAISFGAPIDLLRGSREYYALWLANSWLGEHRNSSSHLYQVIREERGLNYGDYSYIEAFPRGGRRTMPPTGVGRRGQMFEVWIRSVPRDNALFALRAGLREVETLAKNGLTKEEFEFTKRFLKGYCLHFAEGTSQRLGYAIDDRFFGLEKPHLATFRKTMDELTLDEVNAAIRKYMQADNLQIAIVTSDAAAMKDALVSGAASPVNYPKGAPRPKEVLEEDKMIESWPLGITAERVTIVPVTQMFAAPPDKSGAEKPSFR